MRYLFFDIECADGNRAICEFGFVICDEKFNVLNKTNYVINPECKFNLTNRTGHKDLTLTYTPEEYYKCEPFPQFYDNIKFLLTQKDLMIFGHSVDNDIRYLIKDCNFYGLDKFDYVAYDVQKMLPMFDKSNLQFTSLEHAYNELVDENIRSGLLDHRAEDDAMKTMLVLKAMINNLDFSVEELIESCPDAKTEALLYWKNFKAKYKLKDKRKLDEKKRQKGHALWRELCEEHKTLLDDPNSIDKFVIISHKLESKNDELQEVIQIIKNKGYVAYPLIEGTDLLVAYDDENREYLLKNFKKQYNGKILTFDEFIKMNK